MSSHKAEQLDLKNQAERFYQYGQQVLEQDAIENVPDEVIQKYLTMALKLYVRKIETEHSLSPFVEQDEVTPTEAVKTVIGMLEAVDVEIFELGLWKSFGRDH